MQPARDSLEGLHELARCRSKAYDRRKRVLIVTHGGDRNGDPCFETGLPAAATGIVAMPNGLHGSRARETMVPDVWHSSRSMWLSGVVGGGALGN
ncbi:MAG: hypothetical protein OXL34_11545 [Gemmatimonadota bacterium]|nr:hypothetical protein [Gemmatimonadota bacterium]